MNDIIMKYKTYTNMLSHNDEEAYSVSDDMLQDIYKSISDCDKNKSLSECEIAMQKMFLLSQAEDILELVIKNKQTNISSLDTKNIVNSFTSPLMNCIVLLFKHLSFCISNKNLSSLSDKKSIEHSKYITVILYFFCVIFENNINLKSLIFHYKTFDENGNLNKKFIDEKLLKLNHPPILNNLIYKLIYIVDNFKRDLISEKIKFISNDNEYLEKYVILNNKIIGDKYLPITIYCTYYD